MTLHDSQQAARTADYILALDISSLSARGPPREDVTEDLLAGVFGVEASVSRGKYGLRITPLAPVTMATATARSTRPPFITVVLLFLTLFGAGAVVSACK